MEYELCKRVRTNIKEYLVNEGFLALSSHAVDKIPLYAEKVSRTIFTSDVVIIAIREGMVRLIVEIHTRIRSKDTIGIIGAISISTIYSDGEPPHPLKDIALAIISKLYDECLKNPCSQAQCDHIQHYFADIIPNLGHLTVYTVGCVSTNITTVTMVSISTTTSNVWLTTSPQESILTQGGMSLTIVAAFPSVIAGFVILIIQKRRQNNKKVAYIENTFGGLTVLVK